MGIRRAKALAWEQLLRLVNEEPWGKPYRVVLGRMRPAVPPLTETLDSNVLERILAILFPKCESAAHPVEHDASSTVLEDPPAFTDQELRLALRRMQGTIKAPGPDGVVSKVWLEVFPALGPWVLRIFTDCLRDGQFPKPWKMAKLVLLHKPGRPEREPSSYRPLCLIDDVCKLFERLIVNRISSHLSTTGPDLSPNQFGFRRGLSTLDAVLLVREITTEIVNGRGIAIAVSIDIVNAFNTIPWTAIHAAMQWHGFPPYLAAVIRRYLRDRHLFYQSRWSSANRRHDVRGSPGLCPGSHTMEPSL